MGDDDRRDQILTAAERVATFEGLDKLTMRSAAAEAGVSLRLVQYYFGSKSSLLEAVLTRFSDRSFDGWRARVGDEMSAREKVRAFVDAALPLDEERRAFHRLGVAFASLALSDPRTAAGIYRANLDATEAVLVDLIRSAALECAADDVEWSVETRTLMSLIHGVGTMIMVEQIDGPEARRIVDRFLADRVYFHRA